MHNVDHSLASAVSSPFRFLPNHWWRRLIISSFLIAAVLGVIGYLQHQEDEKGLSLGNALYHTAQLFLLHTPHFEGPVPVTLEIARWMAAATMVTAVVRFGRRLWREERAARRLLRVHGHVVICGLGRKGFALVRTLRALERQVVVIDKAPASDRALACENLGVHVMQGDATREDALRAARVGLASSVVALCPDDTANCETAAQVWRLAQGRQPALEALCCHVHLSDVDTRVALQRWLGIGSRESRVKFQFLDAFDPEARRLLIHGLPIDHEGIGPGEDRPVHLVILGSGRMGRSLMIRAAQLGHFAHGLRLRISVIDRRAQANRDALLFRYPRICEVCDLEFHSLEALAPETRVLLERWCADHQHVTSVAVCFDNEQRAFELGVQLLPLLKTNNVRMAIRMGEKPGWLISWNKLAPAMNFPCTSGRSACKSAAVRWSSEKTRPSALPANSTRLT